jgi:hypothetical protein
MKIKEAKENTYASSKEEKTSIVKNLFQVIERIFYSVILEEKVEKPCYIQ